MDPELTQAFNRLEDVIESKAKENREAIDKVHHRITEQGTDLTRKLSDHVQDSSTRSTEIRIRQEIQERESKRVAAEAKADTKRVEEECKREVDKHWDWHAKQKTRSWQMWLAILGAVFTGFLSLMMKACEIMAP